MKFLVVFLSLIPLGLSAQSEMIIEPGAFINIDSAVHLTLNNTNMSNKGQVHANQGSLIFQANDYVKLSGSGSYFLHNITIDSRDFAIESDLYIQNELELKSGFVDISNSDIELGLEAGQLIGENLNNFFYSTGSGVIRKVFSFENPFILNPGNLGLEISSTEELGFGEVVRSHQSFSLNGENSISRTYELITDNARKETIDVKLYFRMQEASSPLLSPTLWTKSQVKTQSIYTSSFGENNQKGNYVVGRVSPFFNKLSVGEEPFNLENSDTPTAFTPDGDGINDTFYIPFIESLETAHVMIFNRWGEKIYESSNYLREPWNGQWNGKTLEANTFYYKVRIPDQKTVEGKVSIIR